jgi:DNA-binding winged helix-turn-helix (wHTH) protein
MGLITCGDVTIDTEAQRVTQAGAPVDLSGLSVDLLAALAKAAPEPVSNAELAELVWGRAHVTDHTIAQRVAMVRRALGDDRDDPKYVRTLRGRGYAFVQPSSAAPQTGPSAAGRGWMRPLPLAMAAGAVLLAVVTLLLTGRGDGEVTAPPQELRAELTDPATGASAVFTRRAVDAGPVPVVRGPVDAVLVDAQTGAVRIAAAAAPFLIPVRAEVDGTPLYIGGVPELSAVAAVPAALDALCRFAEDRSAAASPVPADLVAFFETAAFAAACGAG